MISPYQLTKENGFEDGVVVEIVWTDGIKLWQQVKPFPWLPGDFENGVVSIRPLTGPMAIWNFAPPFAEYCQVWPLTLDVHWIPKHGEIKSVGRVTKRPFWARSGE